MLEMDVGHSNYYTYAAAVLGDDAGDLVDVDAGDTLFDIAEKVGNAAKHVMGGSFPTQLIFHGHTAGPFRAPPKRGVVAAVPADKTRLLSLSRSMVSRNTERILWPQIAWNAKKCFPKEWTPEMCEEAMQQQVRWTH